MIGVAANLSGFAVSRFQILAKARSQRSSYAEASRARLTPELTASSSR